MELPGKYNNVSAQYVENTIQKEILIKSLQYLPSFLQDKPLFKDASKLLDVCLSQDIDILSQIHQAYCDTLYKNSAYQQLSYGAKTELLKENGFDYLLDLLKHIYIERYNQLPEEQRKRIKEDEYIEKQTATNLSNITMLFNLLYILKGKTLGLELALKLVNCPDFIYLTWDTVANYKGEVDSWEDLPLPGGDIPVKKGDAYTVNLGGESTTDAIFNGVSWHKCTTYKEYTTPRQQFTAELTIWGLASSTLQVKISDFVESYMLPYIEINLRFSDSIPAIYCFPSGDRSLLHSYYLSHYYENGILIQHQLDHAVSENGWRYTELHDLPITMGQPVYNNKAFQGTVDLNNSYVVKDGVKHKLYGESKMIPDFITGDALNSLTDEGTISFNNDYVQAPLTQDYTLVDIVLGDQQNPTWTEDEFIRDTIIKYPRFVNETEFDSYIDEAEVYAGRKTTVECTNKHNIMIFETSEPTVRETTVDEEEIHLVYTDATINDNSYTGIGDLGILGSNAYFIYNGMLFFNDGDLKQVGGDTDWEDVGAAHAVSDLYYTPAIRNGQLNLVKEVEITECPQLNNEEKWTNITGYINEFYSAFGIRNGKLYRIYFEDEFKIQELDNGNWDYITGIYYSNTYKAYGIKDGVMYKLGEDIQPIKVDGKILTGWDSSFDCISRYHHTNKDYITYGICNGKLYYICDEEAGLLDDGNWSAICGFYNDNSPRTFAYAIKEGSLYELQGKTVVLKDDTRTWTDISGSTTSTKTFVLGIADSQIYQINAKTLSLLSEETGWTECFGRYTTSTVKNNTCYGFGVKNNRLQVLNSEIVDTVPGMWKVDGEGPGVDLADYNITNLTVRVGDAIIEGIDNVKKAVPVGNEDLSTYDIYVKYTTIGFENNTRYEIKTSMSEMYYTYIDPTLNREDVFMENSAPLGERTGNIENFTNCTLIVHGNQKINGEGESYEFSKNSYLEIPVYYDIKQDEFGNEIRTEKPITEAVFKIGCIVGQEMLPIILDENENGIYYGYSDDLLRSGLFVKTDNYTKIISVEQGKSQQLFIKFDNTYNVSYSLDGDTFTDLNVQIGSPKYLGGNGNIIGDSIIFLAESYIVTDEKIPLYTNGKYFSFKTQEKDVIERIITPANQECQKVIEIQDSEKNPIIELKMDRMYVSRNVDCTNPNLQLKDNFIWLCLNFGDYEGVTTSTLVYSGSYTLDPEKAVERGNLKELSNYDKTAVANNFGIHDYIDLTLTDIELEIETSDDVEYQILFQTEEHTAYTNKYLLTSELTAQYTSNGEVTDLDNDKKKENHVVPSGKLFEIITDSPGVVTRNLEYNAGGFEIDPDKIYDYEQYTYDPYTGLLSEFDDFVNNSYCIVPLNLDLKSKQGNINVYDTTPILHIKTNGINKQKILQIGDKNVYLDTSSQVYLDDNGNPGIAPQDQEGIPGNLIIVPYDPTGIDETQLKTDSFTLRRFDLSKSETSFEGYVYSDLEFDSMEVYITHIGHDKITEEHFTTSVDNKNHFRVALVQKAIPWVDDIVYVEGQVILKQEELDITFKNFKIVMGNPLPEYNYPGFIEKTEFHDWKENSEYKLKFEIERESFDIQNIQLHETTSTEEKDKFHINEGVISNFSSQNYIEVPNLTESEGLYIQFNADDDISKDQGLIGLVDGQSICIKDRKLSLCDDQGQIIEQADIELEDYDRFLLRLVTDDTVQSTIEDNPIKIFFSRVDENVVGNQWTQIFENTITLTNNMFIGFADTGVEAMPFNGSVDLTKTYLTDGSDILRTYKLEQTTNIYVGVKNGEIFEFNTDPIIVKTDYVVNNIFFGFEFTGALDMVNSELVYPYQLCWTENKIPIDTVIKQELEQADPSYDPDLDPNIYGIEEYGLHILNPKRWDTVSVTYNTIDHAYYMEPNTTYYLRYNVEIDENGNCILDKVDNPTWNNAIISDFENGYYEYTFSNEQYIVLDVLTNTTEDQGLCGYKNGGQHICIKDGKWQYFDDTEYHVICDALENSEIYFKLFMNTSTIEYSTDNINWSKTEISASFSGYESFTLGRTNDSIFKGKINLKNSYIITDEITYLFTNYKKVIPYISKDKQSWTSLVLEPMLTLKNTISFGQGFDGSLKLKPSDLLLYDSAYWSTNQVNIYSLLDIPEDNIFADDLIRTVIRDSYKVDPSRYWTSDETIKIDPNELKLEVTGLPNIGDIITITYDSWYLFREMLHEYDFKITYKDNVATVSYQDVETGKEYNLYQTTQDNHYLNTGYNFWGAVSVKDSYRGAERLCDYIEWYTHLVEYRKYGDLDWTKWTQFSSENKYTVFERVGYDLKGILYMETSYVKMGNLIAPFLAYWNGTYLSIVGGVDITNGIASKFTENDYLMIEDVLSDGDMVSFDITFGEDIDNQGISKLFNLKYEYINYNDEDILKIFPGYRAVIEYHIQDGKIYGRIVGNNTTNFKYALSQARTLTIIPYNKNLNEHADNYYIKSLETSQKIQVFYRTGNTHYDHFTPPKDLYWYPATLQKVDEISYYGTTLKDIYVAVIKLGYTFDKAGNATNTNSSNVEYLDNDDVEYKIIDEKGTTTLNKIVLYADKVVKQKTTF